MTTIICIALRFLSTLSLRRATAMSKGFSINDILDFYPRSPCGERLDTRRLACSDILLFLSTLSLRRATSHSWCVSGRYRYFYPRSPCGERPCAVVSGSITAVFLSTLSLRRATFSRASVASSTASFLSTLSLRRATVDTSKDIIKTTNFYPRSPCGERP